MKRVLLVQHTIEPPGGGNGVAAWILEALKDVHTVTLLSWGPQNLDRVNRFWGTTIAPEQARWLTMATRLQQMFSYVPLPLSLLQQHVMMRQATRIADAYDVVITAMNEATFGRRTIQYIHFPWAYQPRPHVDHRWYHRAGTAVRLYYALCRSISGFTDARTAENLTLVNSDWIGDKFHECYGVRPTTLFPPIVGNFPARAWDEREDGFVAIGRIAPEKELEKIIAVLDALRGRGFNVHLHIIGTGDNPAYYAMIHRLVAPRADWVQLDEGLSRPELVDLVSRHRYGIHGMREEHFGMAVGELVRGGCIVFAPNDGGQVDILGDSRLLYDDRDDAVRRIAAVLGDRDLQTSLRGHLAGQADALAPERFVNRIRDLVEGFS